MSDVVTFLITLQNSAMQRHFATQHWECLEMTLKWCEGNPDRQFQRLKTESCMQLFSFLFRSLAQNQLMASAEDSIIRFSSAQSCFLQFIAKADPESAERWFSRQEIEVADADQRAVSVTRLKSASRPFALPSAPACSYILHSRKVMECLESTQTLRQPALNL